MIRLTRSWIRGSRAEHQPKKVFKWGEGAGPDTVFEIDEIPSIRL